MELFFNTVSPLLKKVLLQLMNEPLFDPFRLVGGSNLSLRYGHRLSIDIDLFTDAEYDSLDFNTFEEYLTSQFSYYYSNYHGDIVGFGRSYYVGNSLDDCVKIDLMYSDPFIRDMEILHNIRMASVDDIVSMKMNIISRGGRKKDFWDIHYLLNLYSFKDMLSLHAERYEWEHEENLLIRNFTNFSIADNLPDPICTQNKGWDDIKLDLIEFTKHYKEA